MAFQVDFSIFFNILQQDPHQIDEIPNRLTLTKQTIHQNLYEILQNNYDRIIREADQLTDMTEVLQNILSFSKQLECQFQQSSILKQKLKDIDEDVQNYFQAKQDFNEIIQDYISDFQKHCEMKQIIKTISKDDLPREITLNTLQKYASLTKKLADYSTFQNDLIDLMKIEERFKMFESEEDYLQYQLIAKNKSFDQLKESQTSLLCHFFQMLAQSIKYLISHQACPIILLLDDNQNISEELILQYKQTIILKIYDTIPSLIVIDKEQSNVEILCIFSHRLKIKVYLENYKNYLSNLKSSYMLMKNEFLLEQIFLKMIGKLKEIRMIQQCGNPKFEEMLKSTQKILLYQQDLQELDYFQFLDQMDIELS
ncbi:unnamed protein product [Paramecium sonneborni]|uniref:Uncharacterized protein n=1 Tax=Paramecium sonneborni TaxID=65129 RepID=A0A8S1P5G3_9CILI|nr:unnamed protein product [Paramecium sonneborni]